ASLRPTRPVALRYQVLQVLANSPIGVIDRQTVRRFCRRVCDFRLAAPFLNRFAQSRVGEDELDRLVLYAEDGGPVLLGQFAVEFAHVGEGGSEQQGVLGGGVHRGGSFSFCKVEHQRWLRGSPHLSLRKAWTVAASAVSVAPEAPRRASVRVLASSSCSDRVISASGPRRGMRRNAA